MKFFRNFFDDWLMRSAGIVFVLIIVSVVFSMFSDLPEEYPLFGVFSYSMIPILFVAGGIIFILAILRESE